MAIAGEGACDRARNVGAHGLETVALFDRKQQRQTKKIVERIKRMSEPTSQDLKAKVEELETRLEASLDAIAHLVKAVEYLRANDSQGIFDLDLAKHALNEAGYEDETLTEALGWQGDTEHY
ncbi:MAG TPA: hypothetical protein V6D37_13235 [Candidatus Sericytochromatia bacterium]